MALRSPWRFVNRCNKSSCPELKSAKSVSLLCCIGQSAHTHTPDSLFFANGCGGRSRMIATPHPCRCLALFFDQIIVRLNTSVARVDCHLACVPGRTVGQTEREREREREKRKPHCKRIPERATDWNFLFRTMRLAVAGGGREFSPVRLQPFS